MKVARPSQVITMRVNDAGVLVWTEKDKRAITMLVATFAGKEVDLSVVEHEATRSIQANAYYWACVLAKVEESNVGYRAEEFHELMLEKFGIKKHYEIVNRQTGEVEAFDIPQRSSKMTIRDFYHFVNNVRDFVAEFYGIETEDPDPEYWRKAA